MMINQEAVFVPKTDASVASLLLRFNLNFVQLLRNTEILLKLTALCCVR